MLIALGGQRMRASGAVAFVAAWLMLLSIVGVVGVRLIRSRVAGSKDATMSRFTAPFYL